jgi:uncharacterized protein involved in tolerance to divalent cations
MEQQQDVSYQVVQVDSLDEAESLANYLIEHGVAAFAQTSPEVNVPMILGDVEAFSNLTLLTKTWRMYWEATDVGLGGLQTYTKPD